MSKGKVIVGLSGGVDSSVAALLLKEQGYEVIGVTMVMWDPKEFYPDDVKVIGCGMDAVNDAKNIAKQLGIPHYVLDFKKEFKACVMQNFADEYFHARTPNPCVRCNRFIKWEALLAKGRSLGADYVATGHYAKIEKLGNGRYALKKASSSKDQTYALYNLTQEQLSHTLMPDGAYTKDEIRKIAAAHGLIVANKPDSQDICFIPDGDYHHFLNLFTGEEVPEGSYVDKEGVILGRHKGITHYTIGQRKGLNLAMGHPVFVSEIRPETNEVVIGENEDIFFRKLTANAFNWMGIAAPKIGESIRVTAKIRYAHKDAPATITRLDDDLILCEFDEPVRAITPGQALVIYDGDYVAGGGIIIGKADD